MDKHIETRYPLTSSDFILEEHSDSTGTGSDRSPGEGSGSELQSGSESGSDSGVDHPHIDAQTIKDFKTELRYVAFKWQLKGLTIASVAGSVSHTLLISVTFRAAQSMGVLGLTNHNIIHLPIK